MPSYSFKLPGATSYYTSPEFKEKQRLMDSQRLRASLDDQYWNRNAPGGMTAVQSAMVPKIKAINPALTREQNNGQTGQEQIDFMLKQYGLKKDASGNIVNATYGMQANNRSEFDKIALQAAGWTPERISEFQNSPLTTMSTSDMMNPKVSLPKPVTQPNAATTSQAPVATVTNPIIPNATGPQPKTTNQTPLPKLTNYKLTDASGAAATPSPGSAMSGTQFSTVAPNTGTIGQGTSQSPFSINSGTRKRGSANKYFNQQWFGKQAPA